MIFIVKQRPLQTSNGVTTSPLIFYNIFQYFFISIKIYLFGLFMVHKFRPPDVRTCTSQTMLPNKCKIVDHYFLYDDLSKDGLIYTKIRFSYGLSQANKMV